MKHFALAPQKLKQAIRYVYVSEKQSVENEAREETG